MANKGQTEERSRHVLLRSNCKRYLDVLVPSSLVQPIAEGPQTIITVDDRYLQYSQSLEHPREKPHEVIVELKVLEKLSLNWLILPIHGLDLYIDLQSVPDDILSTILGILRGFGHVPYYHLRTDGNNEIEEDLRGPTTIKRILEVLRRLENELWKGESTFNGFKPREIFPHAISFISHIFRWYNEPTYSYYSRNIFEKDLDEKHCQELEKLSKSLSKWKKLSAGKGERKSQRLASQVSKPLGVSKRGREETDCSRPSKKLNMG